MKKHIVNRIRNKMISEDVYNCPLCNKIIVPAHDIKTVTRNDNVFSRVARSMEIHWLKILYCNFQNQQLFNDGYKKLHRNVIKTMSRKVKRQFKKLTERD